jgi:hypothetical protein
MRWHGFQTDQIVLAEERDRQSALLRERFKRGAAHRIAKEIVLGTC